MEQAVPQSQQRTGTALGTCNTSRIYKHPFTRFPYFILTILLFLPTILFQPISRQGVKTNGGVASAKPTPLAKRGSFFWRKNAEVEKRQTIDEQMIEADEYKWGGSGDGSEVCKRWSHQSSIVGNTIYIYGGQAMTSADQNDHRWNSNFLSLSLTDTFQISSPPITPISKESSGPPPVANAYLFTSLTDGGKGELYLYGGLFSDKPYVRPTENSIWKFSIQDSSWSEIRSSSFKISDDSEQKYIDRAAEGAGISVPERGLGFYFGGHLDGYTTRGWSQDIPRIYLKSLLELRFPGGTNGEVGDGEVGFRNVSAGSGLDRAGMPESADGVLVFVPWGKEGLLVGIGGGRNETFSQLNIVNIYDLSTSTWARQATTGPTPKYRVNPCAVVASAPDGSSHNIYFYGGQNLVPYGSQVQYDDMWILSIPAFIWIKVDVKDSVPPGRAGHTCEIRGRQMIIIGGYVSKELSCDSPGVYVFDATDLQWKREFVGLGSTTGVGGDGDGGNGDNGDGDGDGGDGGDGDGGGGDGGSGDGGDGDGGNIPDDLSYHVPDIVQSVIGGTDTGGATVTKPVIDPTDDDSPLQTVGEVTYTYSLAGPEHFYTYTRTITHSDGSVITETSVSGGGDSNENDGSGPNIGLIIGAIVGGIVGLVVLMFIGLFILYKRKIRRLREQKLEAERQGSHGHGVVMWDAGERNRRASRATTGTAGSGGTGGTERRSTDELLMDGAEPSFWGVLLSPRRSLRVVNR